MKRTLLVTLVCVLLGVSALAQSPIIPNPAFDKIKTLAGNWNATVGKDKMQNSYKVMGAGSTVVLTQQGEKPGDEMVTVFHPDNKDLMVTHYCAAKNQPRMKMVPSTDPNEVKFTFVDSTNLPDPKMGHMVGLKIKFISPTHHQQEWTYSADGKETSEVFDLEKSN